MKVMCSLLLLAPCLSALMISYFEYFLINVKLKGNRSLDSFDFLHLAECRTASPFAFLPLWLGRKDLNPRNGGVRVHCLTTWRRPNFYDLIILSLFREFVNTFYKKNQIYYKKISVKIRCKSLSIPTAKRRP